MTGRFPKILAFAAVGLFVLRASGPPPSAVDVKNSDVIAALPPSAAVDVTNSGVIDAIKWVKTPASGIADVGLTENGSIWVAGINGTIWWSPDGEYFRQENASGFGRIAAGETDSDVYAVGKDNHTLWRREYPNWIQTPASGVADVAVGRSGRVWIAGTNGSIWYSNDKGKTFHQTKASGFCRLGTHSDRLWAVGCNGTLWQYHRESGQSWDDAQWDQTEASGIADVVSTTMDSLWITGLNGTVWKRLNLPNNGKGFELVSAAPGFTSISLGNGKVYAVRSDGTLWRYKP